MPELVIFKDDTGRMAGFGAKGRRAWQKFTKIVSELEVGETMQFSWRMPRSPAHHRHTFAKLAGLFERQERFDDFERLIDFLKVGAGHVDLFPGCEGVFVAVPKSINWVNLDEQGFIEWNRGVNDFLWTAYAQAALWPHLDDSQRYVCIDSWHMEFNRP